MSEEGEGGGEEVAFREGRSGGGDGAQAASTSGELLSGGAGREREGRDGRWRGRFRRRQEDKLANKLTFLVRNLGATVYREDEDEGAYWT